jgi:WD40 repeat protein/transcriptional regulator with XRE-family HTH domain
MGESESFGQRVKSLRRELGLTQDELARRVGCAPVTLRKVEYDDLRPSVQIAERLAMALNIPLEVRAGFVRQAREERFPLPEPTPTPSPKPEEIGIEDLSGRAIRGYMLGERIGEGGMGVVYRGVQPLVEREVAIKIIMPQFANHPEFIRRFETEAQLVARLEHPHIVPLYDYWREPNIAFLVMRLLRGGSLQKLLEEGPLPMDMALQVMEQVGSALGVAHRVGVIHRDLKPANILLDEDHNAYLADFGIAKNLGNPDLENLTQAYAILGSPDYISPEQIRSEFVRPQSDIYCLGVVLYEILTGQPPFQGPTPIEVMHQHLSAPLPPLAARRAGLPRTLDAVIEHATAKNPLDRYPDVESLLVDLRQAIRGEMAAPVSIVNPAEKAATHELPPLTAADNPYKGLRAFGESDAADFFGREALIQQLLVRMGEGGDLSRLLAVVGPSGSGKSSVVKAGLIPSLRRGGLPGSEDWYIVDLMPGSRPFEEIEASLLRVAVNPPASLLDQLREDERGLLRAINRCLPDDPSVELVLVIDQFEEIFTLVEDETTRAQLLASLVTAALDERSRARFVLTLRADFTDRPLQYVDFGELLRQRMEIVLPLTPDELEHTIVGPAERIGLKVEPELVTAILRDVGGQPGALPLIEYALTELFEHREDRHLTRAAYSSIGGVLGALGRRAEEVFSGLDEAAQENTRQLFLHLVMPGEGTSVGFATPDTRRRVLQSEILSLAPLESVISAFGQARLLSFDRDPVTRGPTLEVAHEALLREWPRFRNWLETSRNDLRMQRLLANETAEWLTAKNTDRNPQDAGFLLIGARLAQFEAWAAGSTVALTQHEHAFLEASLAERQRQQAEEKARQGRELEGARKLAETEKQRAEEQTAAAKRLRQRAWMLAGALTVALLLVFVAIGFARTANTNLTAAQVANTQAAAEVLSRSTAQAQAISERNRADQEKNAAQLDASARTTAEAVAVEERITAQEQAALAFSRELAAAAINNLQVDPERSALLALQALSINNTLEARNALHQALPELHILRKIAAHDSAVTSVAYSLDGKYLATGSADRTAKVWDAETGELQFKVSLDLDVWDVAFSPDDTILATSSFTSVVGWDAKKGQKLFTLAGHTVGSATGFDLGAGRVAFNPDGSRLAVANMDGEPKIWDIASQQVVFSLTGHTAICKAIAYSPDGKILATGSDNGEVKLWDALTGEVIFSLTGQSGLVHNVAFSPDSTRLAAVSENAILDIWDVSTGNLVLRLENSSTSGFRSVVFTKDNQKVIAVGYDGAARMWEVTSGRQLLTLAGHTSTDLDVALSPDGKTLATVGVDLTLRMWDLLPGREVATLTGHNAGGDGVAYSPDGLHLASSGNDGSVEIWDAASGEPLVAMEGAPHPWSGVAYSPDGQYVAAGSWDAVASVWDAVSGRQAITLTGHTNSIRAIAFSPDGKRLATASLDGTAKVWDLDTGKALITFNGHTQPGGSAQTNSVWCIAFSPDGKRLATSGFDMVRVWDSTTGQELLTLPFIGNAVMNIAVAFSPDGKWLASGQFNGLVIVRNSNTGELIYTFAGHSAAIAQIVFNGDGTRLASASFDKLAKVWDLTTGQELASLYGNTANVMSVSFSPDGAYLATSGTDGTLRIYLLRLEDLIALAENRLIRGLTIDECQKYLHQTTCP